MNTKRKNIHTKKITVEINTFVLSMILLLGASYVDITKVFFLTWHVAIIGSYHNGWTRFS